MILDIFKKQNQKTTSELVKEIHTNFYTEVDRLLIDAKNVGSVETEYQHLIDKSKRLERLGFKNSKEVNDARVEIKRLDNIRNENKKKENVIKAINYFSIKYPQYKFITEESVKTICEKYGLIYGDVSKYKGSVPDKNLVHIEKFNIENVDKCFDMNYRSSYSNSHTPISYDYYIRYRNSDNGISFSNGRNYYTECPLEIAAPESDFDTSGMEIKNSKLSKIFVAPDPVVLQPVFFNDTKYYLIVTAWGDEAEDEKVVNHIMN